MIDARPDGIGPAWMSWLGITSVLFGVLFSAYEGNEWMRQVVIENAAPAGFELPTAECPPDELEEEGLSVAECEQLVEDVRSYIVSRPSWFAGVQAWLATIGTLLGLTSIVTGAALASYNGAAARFGALVFAALTAVGIGHFIAAQQAGPIIRGIHLLPALSWTFIHLGFAAAFHVAGARASFVETAETTSAAYTRFEIGSHWFTAVSIFFLFVSSWWMLSLPLPSDAFRFREFPFQLHKNLGITILIFITAMAAVRLTRRRALAAIPAESAGLHKLRALAHVALYVLIVAVCVTGYMSSSYSGWGTTWWWLIDLPYWGREDEELNQLYSDLHVWACLALLLAMLAHIGAALVHAFGNDGVVRRILRS